MTSTCEAVEAERSVLGAIMLDCSDTPVGVDILAPGDFLMSQHRAVINAMRSLYERKEPIDIVTVTGALKESTPKPDGGWFEYLSDLVDSTPTAANLEHYIKLMQSASRRRDFIAVMSEQLKLAENPSIDGDELMSQAVTKLGRLAESRAAAKVQPLSEIVSAEFKAIEARQQGDVSGLPTGFLSLDELTGGMPLGGLVVVAARPGMGKTAFANAVAHHQVVKANGCALMFSLEMSCGEQAQRFIAADGRVDLRRIRTGKLLETDWPKIAGSAGRLHTNRMAFVDKAGLSITELRSIARQYASRHSVGMIVVDYLQLMEGTGDNREQQVASITRGLKSLAKELGVPVLVLSQLNRSLESRTEKRPSLPDLRESGAIEQDADQVIFIYREEYYNQKTDEKGVAEIAVAKNRNGPTGMRKLRWYGEHTLFASLDDEPPRPPERESEYEYEQ